LRTVETPRREKIAHGIAVSSARCAAADVAQNGMIAQRR
jgi:hypothetical protein